MVREDRSCRYGGPTKENGNCTVPDDADGLPVQCVGEWAHHDKHTYLQRYIHATRQVRKNFLVREDRRLAGGAGFVDLFSGPGKVRLRDTEEIYAGSPLIAIAHDEAPFSKIVLCDLDEENVAALRARTASTRDRVEVICGDSNEDADAIASRLPEYGLNLAFVDPFKLAPLRFSTIESLAKRGRMDLVVNFPTQDARRNLERYLEPDNDFLDRALGTREWRRRVRSPAEMPALLDVFVEQLERIGYTGARNRTIPVENSKKAELYRLIFASKNPLGDKIWGGITQHTSRGQRGFPF